MNGQDERTHDEASELLPWFVTGQLDADEQAQVAAHVAGCAECQAEVAFQTQLEAEVARLPLDVERGWARMRGRIEANDDAVRAPARRALRGGWIGWGVAATFAVVAGVSWLPQGQGPQYSALGDGKAGEGGNVVVVFHPETTERQMRETLKAGEARLVDGPTAAGGYVLAVPAAKRTAALAALRARANVVLAEPIDSGTAGR